MQKQRRFRLDEPVPLPHDLEFLLPERPKLDAVYPSGACVSCSKGASTSDEDVREQLTAKVLGRVLAVSSSSATYIVIPAEQLQLMKLLRSGVTLGEAIQHLECSLGPQKANEQIVDVLRHIVARNLVADSVTEEYRPTKPYLQMYVTNRCNLRCRHCYMSSGDALPDEIGTEDRLRALKWFAELCPGSLVTFTGGEALLDPDIFLLLETAKSSGLIVEIYTNGLTVKDADVASRLVELADHVQVSMDGASPSINDNIRGRGTFKGITRAIKLLDQAATIQNRDKFQLRIAMTLTHSNSDDILENMLPLIDSLELQRRPQIRVGVVGKLGRAATDDAMFSDQGDLRIMQAVIVNDLVYKGSLRFPVSSINRFSKSCGMGLTITIGANGAIYPCTITEQKPIGNIKDDNAKSVIASSIGYFAKTNVDAVAGCQDCSIRYFCGGMCRITNLHKKGSMNISACTTDYKKLMVRDIIGKYDAYGLTTKSVSQLENEHV